MHVKHLHGLKFVQRLSRQPYQYRSPLPAQLPGNIPGIYYTLSGGRQTGKSTLLKQWMADLLNRGVVPRVIAFFSGELIDDHHSLLALAQEQLEEMADTGLNCLIISAGGDHQALHQPDNVEFPGGGLVH